MDGYMAGHEEISSDDAADDRLTAPCPLCGWERGPSRHLTLCNVCSLLQDIREIKQECSLTYAERHAVAYALTGIRDLLRSLVNQPGHR